MARRHAEAHARAVVDGDLRRAAGDLEGEAARQAPHVMARLPRPVVGAEVTSARAVGEEADVDIRYSGKSSATTVQARWAERGGRPKIVSLRVIG